MVGVSRSFNPRTGEAFGPELPDTTPAELDDVLGAAVAANARWRSAPRAERAELLRAIATSLDADTARLAKLADDETALGVDSLAGEVGRTTFQLRQIADQVDDGSYLGVRVDLASTEPLPVGHPDLRRTRVPIGPVAVYTASNFPFAFGVAGGDTASALGAGCVAVVKAHPAHPQLSEAIAGHISSVLQERGLPAGIVGLVRGFEAGRLLVTDARIAAAAFTGSFAGGRALSELAAKRTEPIPFYGELGSVNPVFVTPQAAGRETLAADYVASLLLRNGQFCTNPSIFVVPAGSGVRQAVSELVAAAPAAPLLAPAVHDLFKKRRSLLAGIAGAQVVSGVPADAAHDWFVPPELVTLTAADVLASIDAVETECFGPVGLLVEYADPGEAVALADRLRGCLVACVHGGENDELGAALVERLALIAGRVVWNGWPTGVAVTAAQHHGGPFPATTDAQHTSVGAEAITRFVRPVAYQSMPSSLLPAELR
jgi:NADP-dependent aldehyde dehydrogenase